MEARQANAGAGRRTPPAPALAQIAANVLIWYASSVVCTNSSKKIAPFISPIYLTLLQLGFATIASCVLLSIFKIAPFEPLNTSRRRKLLPLLGFCFAAGFTAFNTSLQLMHVSTAMVFRALEPVSTFMLTALFLRQSEPVSVAVALSLLPIVCGAALTSLGSMELTGGGIAVVMMANFMFSARGILVRLAKEEGLDTYNIFFYTCAFAAVCQVWFVWLSTVVLGGELRSGARDQFDQWALVFLGANVTGFYCYMQFSFKVLSQVGVLTHSVCNAMRRPAIIATSVIYFQNEINLLNLGGIMLSCGGALYYGRLKSLAAARKGGSGSAGEVAGGDALGSRPAV